MQKKIEEKKTVLTAELQEIAEWLEKVVKDVIPASEDTMKIDGFVTAIDEATSVINGLKKLKVKSYPDGKKCGGCNWTTTKLFSFEGNSFKEGLCGECFMEMLVEGGRMVTSAEVVPTEANPT